MRKSDAYELVVEPDLTIVNFRVKMPLRRLPQATTPADVLVSVREHYADQAAANCAIVDAVTRDGTRWISETKVDGRSVIRMMVISYLTDESHLKGLQEALNAAAGRS